MLFGLTSAPVAAFESVCIDPGHGGYDSGILSGVKEKDITLAVAKKAAELLKKNGKKVYLTRDVDRFFNLGERIAAANRFQPDILVSVHLSNTEDFAVYVNWYAIQGSEMPLKEYYLLNSRQRQFMEKSKALAERIETALKTEFGLNVFHRELPLPILSSTRAPAVLIEVPLRGVNYAAEIERVAYAIALGVLGYE